jgi:hypothetical protein
MITPEVRGVYLVNVSDKIKESPDKFCVCVSVGANQYFTINTRSNSIYNGVEIKACEEHFWLRGQNRFINYNDPICVEPERIRKRIGEIKKEDIHRVMNEFLKSPTTIKKKIKNLIIDELQSSMNVPEN